MFFPFKKPKVILENSLSGIIDMHSHILPGVDDGVSNLEDSLEILSIYERLGIRKLWLTPHVMEDIPNTTSNLKERFEMLKISYTEDFKKRNEQNQMVELALSAEYMMDGLFQERLKTRDFLPHGENGNYLLVETSYYNPPYNLKETLQKIKSVGFFPILAHPERYVYMTDSDYRELKDMKILFQMNLSSLAGMYGKQAQDKAEKFLQASYYNFVGTDLHRKLQLEHLIKCKVVNFRDKI